MGYPDYFFTFLVLSFFTNSLILQPIKTIVYFFPSFNALVEHIVDLRTVNDRVIFTIANLTAI